MPTVSDNPPTAPEAVQPLEEGIPQEPAPIARGAGKPPAESVPRSSVAFVWSDALWRNRGVPEGLRPGRLLRSYRLLDIIGALRWREVELFPIDESLGSVESLRSFHKDTYIQTVSALAQGQASPWSTQAFGFTETGARPFAGMSELAALYVASARTAVQAVTSGRASRALSLAGGQVHARPAQAQPGAIFNDVLLALVDARTAMKKVAFLNLDAEHPTVVQEHFYSDPHLLTLSLHEDPLFLYPGTGWVKEVGEGAGQGFNVNLPLPAGAGDEEYLWAFEQVMVPLLEQFAPDLVVLLGGGSAHREEPLAHLSLTSIGYQALLERLCDMIPRVVLLGGAGMQLGVMARFGVLALATLAGRISALPPQLPSRYARSWGGGTLHDEISPRRRLTPLSEYVAQRVQETVGQAQQALFPLWSLPIPSANREFYEDTFVPFTPSPVQPRVAEVSLLTDKPMDLLFPPTKEQPVQAEGAVAEQGSQRRNRPKGKKSGTEDTTRKESAPAGTQKRLPQGERDKKQRRRKRSGQGPKGPQNPSGKAEHRPKKQSGGGS